MSKKAKLKPSEVVKTSLPYEELMKKALSTPLPKKDKKAKVKGNKKPPHK